VVDGYTRQLIEESGGAAVVGLDDVAGLIRAIEDLLERKKRRELPRTPKDFSDRYERFRLTGELARHLEEMLDFDKGEIVRVAERAT
jgi:hypothetical protein